MFVRQQLELSSNTSVKGTHRYRHRHRHRYRHERIKKEHREIIRFYV